MKSPIVVFFLFFTISVHSQTVSVEYFGLKIPGRINCTAVKDQYLSSTCWSFASLSFLESELLRMGKGEFDLSEMFIARHSLLRKIHRHLQLRGQNYFTPGGQFHDVAWVIKNHGLVPESAYRGKPDGQLTHNHAELDTVLSRYTKELVQNGVTEMNTTQQQFVDSVLDHYLGKVPDEFNYNGTMYTPYSFLERVVKFDPDDYLEITSFSHHPFYKPFILEDKYNWTADFYINVPAVDFSRITDEALKNGYTVGWDGDAEDNYFMYYQGLAYFPDTISNYQLQRQENWQSGATALNHLMHIVSKVKDKFGNNWYYIKNSWGDYSNNLGGYLFMREDYFKLRTVAIIVHKNAMPADIRLKLALLP